MLERFYILKSEKFHSIFSSIIVYVSPPCFPSARCVAKYEDGCVQPRRYFEHLHISRQIARWGITGS